MKAYIVLKNGQVFEGTRFGAEGDALGELVFTTTMGSYMETLTDACYYGQIVLQTFPLIGNYGIVTEDIQSDKVYAAGYVIRDLCTAPSNFRCEGDLDTFLKERGIVGIYGVDTRELTRILREEGSMTAKIVSELPEDGKIEYFAIHDAVQAVSDGKMNVHMAENPKYSIAVLNLGATQGLAETFNARGCHVTELPYNIEADKLLTYDAIVLSAGPGNPAENTDVIETVRSILGKKPILGMGLGHQILALAAGAKTEKLKVGHRGANVPVRDLETGRVYITAQNHGYAVVADTLPEDATVRFVNANDETCEGVLYESKKAMGLQFEPQRAAFLFDKFMEMVGE